ncbi:MAG TPA: calcium-binding protein [Solirubrobacterales bacterium]|jgi:Ca2+-binding RTX toxin-like protein|nr:calcium-binding protein [Solirubrobacterales bacterium]
MPPKAGTVTALKPTAAALIAAALLCAGAVSPAQAKLKTGFDDRVLNVIGGNGAERVRVRCVEGFTKVNGKNPKGGPVPCAKVVEIDASMGGGDDAIDFSGVSAEFGDADFPGFGIGTGTAAVAGEGNDRYIPSPASFNLFYGEGGNDRATGGPARDVLSGGPGDDVLNGARGRDSLLGNQGNDRLNGGTAADVITGHAGDDRLAGAAGDDIIGGGAGIDRLRGGPGRDRLVGGSGRDDLRGGPGNDAEVDKPKK